MAQNGKSKLKLLYLHKILREETDEEKGLTMPEILECLQEYGISAERKSIYTDLKVLREFDDIKMYQRSPVEYAMVKDKFSIGELMLMVDAILSCRAITENQANQLIKNIKTLASKREQKLLNRRIHVIGRVKSKRESVFGTIDDIHEAINKRRKVEFLYIKFPQSNGEVHIVTPICITYDEGFYYLSAWDAGSDSKKEFRLDRMENINIREDDRADRNEEISNYKPEEDDAVSFGHFKGEKVSVTLACPAEKVEIITDRFGKLAQLSETEDGEVRAFVKVYKSEQFFGWVAGMGKAVRIVSPDSLVKEYRDFLKSLLEE